MGASEHATPGSTILPAINRSHGAVVTPAAVKGPTDVDLGASTVAYGPVRLYNAK